MVIWRGMNDNDGGMRRMNVYIDGENDREEKEEERDRYPQKNRQKFNERTPDQN